MEEEDPTFAKEECTRINEHAHCAYLLSNLVPLKIISKNYKQTIFNYYILKHERELKDMLLSLDMVTGSQAELLNLPFFSYPDWHKEAGEIYHADTDTMEPAAFIDSSITITELPSQYQTVATIVDPPINDFTLVTSPNISPGFCYVAALTHDDSTKKTTFCKHECLQVPVIKDEIDGAAVSMKDENESSDIVPCFLINSWPDYAQSIFTRAHNVWPDQATLTYIKRNTKLAVVRKAHHSSRHPDIEFRLSFSLPEVVLARALPDSVRHVYLTVKLLRQVTDLQSTGLQTYHLKTVLFWIASSEDTTTWDQHNFKEHVLMFLSEIIRAFENQHLQNFFIPESNLLSHLKAADCHEVVLRTNAVVSRLCGVVLDIQSSISLHWCAKEAVDADDDYNRALKHFRRFCKVKTLQQKAVEKSETLRCFKQCLSANPQHVGYMIEHGHFLWHTGEEVEAFVLWLNVLVTYDADTHIGQGSEYHTDDCSRLDPILRLEVQTYTRTAAIYTPNVLAVYFLVTKTELSMTCGKYIIQQLESDPNLQQQIDSSIKTEHKDRTFQRDGSTRLKKWCSSLLNRSSEAVFSCLYSQKGSTNTPPPNAQQGSRHGGLVEAFDSQIRHTKQDLIRQGMVTHVHDISLAICEYTKEWMPSRRRKRRHSFHGTSLVSSKYRKTDTALMVNSLHHLNTTNDVCLQEVEEEHEKVSRRNPKLAELTQLLIAGVEEAKSISEKILQGGENEVDRQLELWDSFICISDSGEEPSSEDDSSRSSREQNNNSLQQIKNDSDTSGREDSPLKMTYD